VKLPLWASALCATLLVQVVSSFAAAAIPLLGPLLMHRWNLPPESIGYVSAMVSIGICWCLACGNPMLDHYGPIRTLQIGLVWIGLGILLLMLTSPWPGFVGAILIGLGTAPNNPAGSKVLMVTAPPRHRTLIFSIRQAGVPFGGAIAGLVVASAVSGLGFDGALWTVVGIVALCIAAVQVFQPRLDAERGPMNRAWARAFVSPSALLQAARVIGSHPALPLLTAAGVSFSIAQASVTAFTATYLVTRHGTTITEAGSLVAVLLAASAAARIVLGWLADRVGSGEVMLNALAIGTGIAILLLVALPSASSWLIYPVVALVGATSMGWNGIYMAELAKLAPPAMIGPVTSAANLFGFVGSILGPVAISLIANLTGNLQVPLALVAIQVAVFGLFAIWRQIHAQ